MKRIQSICAISALMTSSAVLAGSLPASDSGLVTLVAGQTAQLNVVNIDPAASCQITMSLVDSTGAPLVDPQPVSIIPAGGSAAPLQMTALTPGSLRAHLDYSPQLIAQAGLKDPMAGCYNLLPTLEVIDETGTRVIITNFAGMPNSGAPSKITICHKPGTPAEKTLTLPMSAWGGHHGHGDTLGPCPTN